MKIIGVHYRQSDRIFGKCVCGRRKEANQQKSQHNLTEKDRILQFHRRMFHGFDPVSKGKAVLLFLKYYWRV